MKGIKGNIRATNKVKPRIFEKRKWRNELNLIIEDSNNKVGKHQFLNNYLEHQGYEVERYRLPVGDYILANERVNDLIARKGKREVAIKMLDFLGTYKVCVDTKYGIEELEQNVCGKSHDRFRDECILAQNNGIKLYVLVVDDGGYINRTDAYNKPVRSLDDLFSWSNPRLFIKYKGKQKYPRATKGQTLAKACFTMQKKYGVEFLFCYSRDEGKRVLELLGGTNEGDKDKG